MPLPTPFHSRTSTLCESHEWRDWSGYLAAAVYEHSHEREYFAIRNSAALIDVSPLFKYEISGPHAARVVDRIITRDVSRCRVGQVLYSPWCDEDGKVIDDGTIARLDQDRFRITAAHPNLRWFQDVAYGFDAHVADVSQDLAALSIQGPLSRDVLKEVSKRSGMGKQSGMDDKRSGIGKRSGMDLDRLPYFRLAQGQLDGIPATVTRTGYTGDLGYELWVYPQHAEQLWDCIMERGEAYGLLPAGMVALDIARIEAGLLLIDVDYISSHKARIEDQKSSPFELGLGWTVTVASPTDGVAFIGRDALQAEKARGSKWTFVGLEVDWVDLERLYAAVDLPPQVAGRASRLAVPIYQNGSFSKLLSNGRQIGQVTSHTFSPILKKYIAIGTVLSQHAALGSEVQVEVTVEYSREKARATLVKTPFFNPARKRRLTTEDRR